MDKLRSYYHCLNKEPTCSLTGSVDFIWVGRGVGWSLPTMTFTGRLRSKEAPFLKLQVYEREGIL